jgi:hypothetical protein
MQANRTARARRIGRALFALTLCCMGGTSTSSCTGVVEEGALSPPFEATESREGTLSLSLVRNDDGESARSEYHLEEDDGSWTRLLLDRRPDLLVPDEPEAGVGHEHLSIPAGARVKVSGVRDAAGRLVVASIDLLRTPRSQVGVVRQALVTPTPKKVAVILATFSDLTQPPITAEAAREMVFTGAGSVNAYFKEVSFGARSLVGKKRTDGDVFGWYAIADKSTSCDYVSWGNAARAAAVAAGVDLSGYDHVVHYFPRTTACGWAGVGQVPGRFTWINGSTAQTVAHELGHNYGSHHASALTCTDGSGARVAVGGTCTFSEYGDPFDVMGRGFRHLCGFHKERLGFFEPANSATVTADGTFTLRPLETKSTGIQSLRIPIDGTLFYYLEFRQPSPFDDFSKTSSAVNGVLIRRAPAATTLARPQLVDTTPATTTHTDAALTVGKTFTDPAAGISVRVSAVAAGGATVIVDVK